MIKKPGDMIGRKGAYITQSRQFPRSRCISVSAAMLGWMRSSVRFLMVTSLASGALLIPTYTSAGTFLAPSKSTTVDRLVVVQNSVALGVVDGPGCAVMQRELCTHVTTWHYNTGIRLKNGPSEVSCLLL